jgi:hypothetical protein
MKNTVSLAGKRYTRTSCATTKTAAQKVASGIRAKGGTARVIKAGADGYCIYKGPKSKVNPPRKRRTTATAKRRTTATRRTKR